MPKSQLTDIIGSQETVTSSIRKVVSI